jgi:hypothetical protein
MNIVLRSATAAAAATTAAAEFTCYCCSQRCCQRTCAVSLHTSSGNLRMLLPMKPAGEPTRIADVSCLVHWHRPASVRQKLPTHALLRNPSAVSSIYGQLRTSVDTAAEAATDSAVYTGVEKRIAAALSTGNARGVDATGAKGSATSGRG